MRKPSIQKLAKDYKIPVSSTKKVLIKKLLEFRMLSLQPNKSNNINKSISFSEIVFKSEKRLN